MSEAGERHRVWGRLTEYVAGMWRRKWIVLVALIVFPATAFVVALRQDSMYQSSADVLMSPTTVGATVLGVPDASIYQDPQRFSRTQAALAYLPEVAERAARIANTRGIRPGLAFGGLYVAPGVDNDLLRFSVSSGDPRLAVELANAYALAFIGYRREVDRAVLRQERGNLRLRLSELRAAGATGTALYTNLSNKERELSTLELLQSGDRLVTPAATADKIAPTPRADAMHALFVGALFGVALAFLLEVIDKRARSEDEIERRLGLPLLARIPDAPRFARKKKLIMLADPTSGYAEPFRQLQTNLEFLNADRQARTILVTSAVGGEGKSTTVGNLAVAAARVGRHVALVDLDLQRARLHDLLGVPQTPGATDVALGRVALEDALRPIQLISAEEAIAGTDERGREPGTLEFLPIGTSAPDPGEFVGTKGVAEILFALNRRAEYVFIDAAPLLAVGDVLPLRAGVDAIVVITRLGVSSRPMLAELARELRKLPASTLGFVITGADSEKTARHGSAYAKRVFGARGVAVDQP